jgi:hypothetical protein
MNAPFVHLPVDVLTGAGRDSGPFRDLQSKQGLSAPLTARQPTRTPKGAQ